MTLATIANLPTTPEQLAAFAFANMDSHRKIAEAIFQQMNGQIVPLFPFDPIPLFPQGRQVWGFNHQTTHNSQNQILGIQGEDIMSFDLENIEQASAWILQHFNEHYLAEGKLGIT